MKRYNDYKDSGIEWLGNIPKHWETFRFIDNVKLRHGYQFRDNDFTDDGIRVVKISQLDPKGNLNLTKSSFIASNRLNSFKSIRIYQDDILMALTGGTIGKIIRVGKISVPLLQNYRVGNFFPDKKKLNKTFLYFLLASQVTEEQINYLLNRNGQPNIGKESFKNMFFTLPPLKEQTQIANYLDAKTTAIDKKVSLLQQKIKHYKAYRKTLINETVTKGLDKTVKLKDSGIDWIGEIPEHWEVKRLKDLSNFINGFAFNSKEYIDSGIPIIRISNISNDINFEECKYVDSSYLKLAKDSLIKVNDILVAMTGATIGKNAIYKEEKKALLNQRVGIIRAKKLINNLFLFQLIKSQIFKDYIDLLCGGSAQENISKTQIENFYIQLPPLNEQQQIADFLDAKTNTIDNIVNNIETQITTLKELRKTLINEVVTGKVKVTA